MADASSRAIPGLTEWRLYLRRRLKLNGPNGPTSLPTPELTTATTREIVACMDAVERAIEPSYLREVVQRLESLGSHPLGFRVAGTPEERAAARFVAGELRGLGLEVAEEAVPVDGWRLREAYVEAGGRRFEGASFGGVPETGRRGVKGELAVVGRGGRRQLDRIDAAGKILLVEWCDQGLWPYHVAL